MEERFKRHATAIDPQFDDRAAAVAERLDAPLDVIVARKIGAPGHPEFGVGAVTADGPPIYNAHAVKALGLSRVALDDTCAEERAEARRRVRRYHADARIEPRTARDVIVIDDGLATGVTATAALRGVRADNPRSLIFAAPVCTSEGSDRVLDAADDVICLSVPVDFTAVGKWYRDFRQTTDEEVVALLRAAHLRMG